MGQSGWFDLPEVRQAAAGGDYGTLLRVARTAARLTLSEAGQRCGYSAATLSRIERGRQRLSDVSVLRRLATVFDIPPELFGLADIDGPAFNHSGPRLDKVRDEAARREAGVDLVRRRELLGGLAGLVGAAVASGPEAVATPPLGVVTSLEDVILGGAQPPTGPIDSARMRTALASAWSDYRACRYARLSARLPQLVTMANACHAAASGAERAAAAGTLARAYHLTTQVLVKLHEDGMAWSAMDRAARAAREADDPLLHAETARMSAVVLRRTRHGRRAEQTLISAAQVLDGSTGLMSTPQVAAYGRLLATAAYTAAMADRRDAAWDLLHAAHEAGRRSGTADGFAVADVALYRVSVARALGDFGAAVQYARSLPPEHLGSVERRARYWEDYALALYGRGAYAESCRALLAAERTAPQEVRYRPWAQQLTSALLTADRRRALPGLRDLATRVGVSS
ncbi:helix-turn-helix domain-containing protein [Micromonospora sp. WMMC415]|uniref:helix-turn-helix domain-containing protein n=1 Tax=Micromonospora sp. WMMC415 TaxID=2675222 RepID=UPI0018AF6B08|nr:helix-turn-helix transcriptional regulator [Micromonospora sp. WMMC415]